MVIEEDSVLQNPVYRGKLRLSHNHIYNGRGRKNKTPNLNGVSRDHLYTVADGFSNLRDPSILAHPANCLLMIHNGPYGNNSKRNSSITWEELLERIERWNKQNGGE